MREYKAVPLGYAATDVAALSDARAALRDFPTPLVTLSESAVAHNLATMAEWCRTAGVGLAPHGKTTMSRELWQRQLDAGAWGITVATPWQASVALGWGIPRVLLANALVQPAALRALAPDTDRLTVWADSLRGVEIMTEALTDLDLPEPLAVLVELGAPGGRTGARTADEAVAIARAVAASPVLRLAGVAGYEGALAHDARPESLATVRGYLQSLSELHDGFEAEGLYAAAAPAIITAGGSAYFDVVAEVLAPRRDLDGTRGRVVDVLLRSGAYITHDDGFYSVITPLGRVGGDAFRSAIHGWATVVSRPEPGLALVDAGKRDFPYDEGMPVPQAIRALGAASGIPLDGAVVTAMNDQHTFVRLPSHARVEVGDVIRFGLSHPCTTFDKWRALAVVDDALAAEPHVTGLLETAFG
ncbi:alanine racemase [Leifsonia naganoensis]|uniref:D-serine deaminase-like pyridoxal phosphate-dependent protein n=1 Tax=Leifsonia naganoensis TaxID=150025 RepID=A0A853DQD9_9MICO|nr:D-serine deaminase-like pyridoxal phosphate-dependent protein [Leifsonia naganoensis]